MNIADFLQHKTNCAVCGTKLNITFHSADKKQVVTLSDDSIVFKINISYPYSLKTIFKIGYKFNIYNNNFNIEYYSNHDVLLSDAEISATMRSSWNSFQQNLGSNHKFTQKCNSCKMHCYTSQNFSLNYSSMKVEDLYIEEELLSLKRKIENGYKFYRLRNLYGESKSFFYSKVLSNYQWNSDRRYSLSTHLVWPDEPWIKTNLISMADSSNLMNKIDKLYLFS